MRQVIKHRDIRLLKMIRRTDPVIPELKNGGKIVMRTDTDFNAPVGALVDISHGEILRSNDF